MDSRTYGDHLLVVVKVNKDNGVFKFNIKKTEIVEEPILEIKSSNLLFYLIVFGVLFTGCVGAGVFLVLKFWSKREHFKQNDSVRLPNRDYVDSVPKVKDDQVENIHQ